jgi:hypothetical protein
MTVNGADSDISWALYFDGIRHEALVDIVKAMAIARDRPDQMPPSSKYLERKE